MDDIADYYTQQQIGDAYVERFIKERDQRLEELHDTVNNQKVWTTRMGRDIAFKDMSLPHLKNTIAMLDRKANSITDFENKQCCLIWKEALVKELKNR